MPAAGEPKFFVELISTHHQNMLRVVNSATGHVLSRLGSPAPNRQFQAVAAFGNDRTFVAEASDLRRSTRFYQFRLTARG